MGGSSVQSVGISGGRDEVGEDGWKEERRVSIVFGREKGVYWRLISTNFCILSRWIF